MISKPKTKNNGNHALNSLCDYMCQQFTHDAKSLKFGNSGCICIGLASDLKASRLCPVLTMGVKGIYVKRSSLGSFPSCQVEIQLNPKTNDMIVIKSN